MKKITIALICSAILLLTGASIWEGSAVVAASGELPDSGYYIATNSFPKNTVVDVKNLETDKSVRAIVAGGLDSPGLLASLSSEAANAVGLNRRTVGRIRVTMPADPIAFSRFTDGLTESTDPDRNPKAAAADTPEQKKADAEKETAAAPTAEDILDAKKTAPTAASVAPLDAPAAVASAAPPAPPSSAQEPAKAPSAPPVQESKAPTAVPAVEKTIDVPENYVPPAPAEHKEEAVKAEASVLAKLPETDAPAVDLSEPKSAAEEPKAAPEATNPPISVTAVPEVKELAEEPKAEEPKEASVAEEPKKESEAAVETAPPAAKPEEPAGVALAEAVPPVEEPKAAEPPNEAPKEEPATAPKAEVVLDLKPAEERPPKAAETDLTAAPFVTPVEAAPAKTAEKPAPIPSPEQFVTPVSTVPVVEKAKEPTKAPVKETIPVPRDARFSAPLISSLEKGKFYVQIGAFRETDTVKEALSKIGKKIPTAIQQISTKDGKQVYRVIVGPVNQGESGALLIRFKKLGYPDAFIRKGI